MLIVFVVFCLKGHTQAWSGSETENGDAWRSGNVGIGNTSPNYPLDVNGSINATDVLINGESITDDFAGQSATLTDLHVTNVLEIGPNSIHMGVVTTGNTTLSNHIWTPPSQAFPSLGEPLYINDGQAVGSIIEHHTFIASNGARGFVGIGVPLSSFPVAKLHINNDYNAEAIMIERNMAGNTQNNWHQTMVKIGISSNSAQSGLRFEASGDNGGSFTDVLFLGDAGLVGIGTTDPLYELDVAGSIRGCEVIVNRQWCDYVFEPDYKLMPLNELAAYVRTKKHLPGIPTAKEVEEEGLRMGDMQVKMMEKIEELTLYLLELEEKTQELIRENASLKIAVESLEKGDQ